MVELIIHVTVLLVKAKNILLLLCNKCKYCTSDFPQSYNHGPTGTLSLYSSDLNLEVESIWLVSIRVSLILRSTVLISSAVLMSDTLIPVLYTDTSLETP